MRTAMWENFFATLECHLLDRTRLKNHAEAWLAGLDDVFVDAPVKSEAKGSVRRVHQRLFRTKHDLDPVDLVAHVRERSLRLGIEQPLGAVIRILPVRVRVVTAGGDEAGRCKPRRAVAQEVGVDPPGPTRTSDRGNDSGSGP